MSKHIKKNKKHKKSAIKNCKRKELKSRKENETKIKEAKNERDC